MMMLLFLALAVCACSLRGTDSPGGGENPAEGSDAVSGPFAAGGAAGEESAPGDGVIRESLGHGTDAGDPEEQERLELSRKGIYSISGFQSGADGQPASVEATIAIEDIVRGEEAALWLAENASEVPLPEEGEEYIVIGLEFTYVEGDAEILSLMENNASMAEYRLAFYLKNLDSNSENITDCLNDSIHNLEVGKGESVKGRVAFIHNTGEEGELTFLGFNDVVRLYLPKF